MKKKCCILGALVLIFCVFGTTVSAKDSKRQAEILFTHDLHSHLNEFQVEENNEIITVGGAARIKSFLDSVKKKNENVLAVDAGDFSMGTLYQTIYETEASELRMLGTVGIEYSTFGNHEFDYRTDGLVKMLQSAMDRGEALPGLLVCNIDKTSQTEEQQKLYAVFEQYGIKDYAMVKKGDVSIAVIGVFGKDSLACAPTCALSFEDPVTAVKRTVETIEKEENADLIICLSHSGTSETPSKSEDEILAKEVPQLDLIVSGHSHTLLPEPYIYGDTAIVSSGEYGAYVGDISLEQKENGRWSIVSYAPVLMNESIVEDEAIKEELVQLSQKIDDEYLDDFGYTQDQVLADNSYTFESVEEVYQTNQETRLGDLLADSYIYTVENAVDYNGVPVDFTVVPSGIIRDSFYPGEITVSDVFNVFSLGIGEDKIPGYPLISVYLTGKELKTAAEVDASVSPIMTSARLYCGGFGFTFEQNRMILNKTTDTWLIDHNGEHQKINNDKLYRVVTDLYTGQMLSAVNDMSKGILKLVPKDENGTPITNFEDCILYENGREVKNWIAVARYMADMQDKEGGVSETYSRLQGRKTAGDSKNIIVLLKHPNQIACLIYIVLFFIIVIIVFVIVKIHKLIKHRGNMK